MLRRLWCDIGKILKKTIRMAESVDGSKQLSAEKRVADDVLHSDDGEGSDTEPAKKKTKQELSAEKRVADDVLHSDDGEGSDTEPAKKKTKQEPVAPMQGRTDRKRKVAMLLTYCGKGYYGIQRNQGFNTIEEELLKALLACQLIPQEHFDCPQKMSFQRAARTDKGVSAVGNVVSLKMLLNQEDLVQKLNEALPAQIRVVAFKRATKAFNSKNQCGGRTYAYLTPTYAFAPVEKFITEEYRTTGEIISEVNRILSLYKGTRNFHNFTSGIKPNDPSAKRYIISFECAEPFVQEGIEFVIIRVKGQSFMLHHIRKMIGLMIAVVKGYCGQATIDKSWQHEKVDIPRAPGLGLMLEQLHYDGYNKKYGQDGMHEAIEWSQYEDVLDKFKVEQIYTDIMKSEKEEKVMMKWLGTLQYHKFDMKDPEDKTWWPMKDQLQKSRKEEQNEKSATEPNDSDTDMNQEANLTSKDDRETKHVEMKTDSAQNKDSGVSSSTVTSNTDTVTS